MGEQLINDLVDTYAVLGQWNVQMPSPLGLLAQGVFMFKL
jgi:hypothetical protein